MDNDYSDLIFKLIDGTISSADFQLLQTAIEQNEQVRTEYLQAVQLCESLSELATDSQWRHTPTVSTSGHTDSQQSLTADRTTTTKRAASSGRLNDSTGFSWQRTLLAAAVLLFVGGAAFRFGQKNVPQQTARTAGTEVRPAKSDESKIAGHASLRRSVDLAWPEGAVTYREGDVLPHGLLQFDRGVAEIDFFCGATMIVEGPAILDVESDWSVRVIEGRLRANVPPAARGFIVKADDSEIIDLGTEFALEVGSDGARIEVLDGEVELKGGPHDGDHLFSGQHQLLKGTAGPDGFAGLSTGNDVQRLRNVAEQKRFDEWKQQLPDLTADPRLVACYPIASFRIDRSLSNAAATGTALNAQLVGPVNKTFGRFGSASNGLEFNRPGARVRARIDSQFQAFTFTAWVKIDSLEHAYNAIFMADGYENGEPHWQIQDDGRLMFSVMVDDSQSVHHFSEREQTFVDSAGLARVYYTKPFWNISHSGQWFHLAAVYNPADRQVNQYVNGKQISSEPILDRFHIADLRIGPAEIGNWGQPFRQTPWFSVRNLNGTIDELSVFNAALSDPEIHTLYLQGKPLDY